MTDRIQNSFRNISSSLAAQLLSNLIGFAARTVFIYTLGQTYLGMEGLFGDVLQLLSLTDLGMGTALRLSFYKPLADNNALAVAGLMRTYRKVSLLTGFAFLLLGLCFIPFLDFFVAGSQNVENLVLIYMLYVLKSFVGCFFSYKKAVIQADQKEYIITLYSMAFSILKNVILIILLLATHNFIAYLVAQILLIPLENYVLARKADKMYPCLKWRDVPAIEPHQKQELNKKMRAMIYHRVGDVVTTGTDNLIITKFLGLAVTGCYTAYFSIRTIVAVFISALINGLLSGVGKMVASEDTEFCENTFYRLEFISFSVRSCACICMVNLFQPFIQNWAGANYLVSVPVMLLIVAVYYLENSLMVTYSYRNAVGLFYNDRYKTLIEAAINLALSLWLVQRIGLLGVLLGTLLSQLVASAWVEPCLLYKNYFKKPVRRFFKMHAGYLLFTIVGAVLVNLLCRWLPGTTILTLLARFLLVGILTVAFYLARYVRTTQFRELWQMALQALPESLVAKLPRFFKP